MTITDPAEYRRIHDIAAATYEAAVPVDYRYSALALRKAVDAALSALAPQAGDNAEEPVAWTTQAQLDGIKGTGNNGIMWGEPLPYHPDIPLYAHPVEAQGDKRVDIERLTRPIIGIENRTGLEAFDIMTDRIRSALASAQGGEG
ncbi:hypothetical protein EVB67_029 [Rhizobium phage RHph_TM3_3_14B]|nr:hypothetical protein EVB67_029 [Rhizobium phage RHph_TM3_3_14B]